MKYLALFLGIFLIIFGVAAFTAFGIIALLVHGMYFLAVVAFGALVSFLIVAFFVGKNV